MVDNYPFILYLCGAFLAALLAEACLNLHRPWSIPAIGVYLTTFGWYFVDPFQYRDVYSDISPQALGLSYLQVGLFLLTFRFLVPKLSLALSRSAGRNWQTKSVMTADQLFLCLLALWIPLLVIGIYRLDGNVLLALLPLEGRAGANMWGRGALGGSYDSLVSAGGYIYQLVCGLMGVTCILQKNGTTRWLNLAVLMLSIPYFLLGGTRSIFIAVVAPLMFTYLLVGQQRILTRMAIIIVAALAMNLILLVVIENRNTGFRFLVEDNQEAVLEKVSGEDVEAGRKQLGLNMIQELCFINEFSDSGTFKPAYGMRYFIELTNIIPRALWPGKPMIGIDYAVWRGFGNGETGIGVNATISTGMIGGGVMNFGRWFGPIVAGFLMSIWAALLSSWWTQRASILRLCLFMAGLGLTFNLGRDITLLVLWPVVFAYLLVRLTEAHLGAIKRRPLRAKISRNPSGRTPRNKVLRTESDPSPVAHHEGGDPLR